MRCPICRRNLPPPPNPFAPFCSEHCKLVDLAKWMGEEYKIPGPPIVDDEDGAPSDGENNPPPESVH